VLRAMFSVTKIISGGQTGADRAALDFALTLGIPHGGWCPRGRLAEDGPVPECYVLSETPTRVYAIRTEWNVRDSDGTVIFTIGRPPLSGGSLQTWKFAERLGRPVMHLSQRGYALMPYRTASTAQRLRGFIEKYGIQVLNVAGSRASAEPGVGDFVAEVLKAAWG
jgi:hypothetical protein